MNPRTEATPIEYLYLDDETWNDVKPYVSELEESVNPALKIKHRHPKPYKDQMVGLEAVSKSLHGLILDLRLDQYFQNEKEMKVSNPDAARTDEDQADYRAATIAQEIRTRATEALNDVDNPECKYEFPIVLCSTDERLKISYNKDDTSHDLFDLKFVKTDIVREELGPEVARKLLALVEGYREIQRIRHENGTKLSHYLGGQVAESLLDLKVLTLFDSREGLTPAHEFARFITRELLDTSGPLIDKQTLAARLGVDISSGKSLEFDTLLEKHFNVALYQGVFASGWPLWWAASVEKVWRELVDAPGMLRITSSIDRVNYLKDATKIHDLVPAEPLVEGASRAFWVVCRATSKPIDPKEGYLLSKQPNHPWQDRAYISRIARESGRAAQLKMSLSPSEEARYIKSIS